MEQVLKDKINLIQILDCICIGIIGPTTPPTVLKMGGTFMHLGILLSIVAATRMISAKVFGELQKIYGTKRMLKYCLMGSVGLNAALLLTYSPLDLLVNRILFTFVNQVPMFCALLSSGNKEKSLYKNPQAQRISATLLGCAIVGSFIDYKGGFYVLAVITTSVSVLELAILLQEPSEVKQEKKFVISEAVAVFPKTYASVVKTIRGIDIHFANWEALLIKSLLVSNSTVVFVLYVVMVTMVFQGTGSWVCTTAAYQTVMMFLAAFGFEKLKPMLKKSPKEILEKSTLICAICAFILALSPSYTFYLFMFVPFLIARTFVENYYVEVFDVGKNQKLGEDLKVVVAVTEIVGPWFIGFLFYVLKYNAYRLLAVLPIVAVYFIVRRKTYKVMPEGNDSGDKNVKEDVKKNKDE